MSATDEWSNVLHDHPIFSLPKSFHGPLSGLLELSTTTLPKFTNVDPQDDKMTPSGRRQVMILKDAELIVAAGKEVRISSVGDLKLSQSMRKSYKVGLTTCESSRLTRQFPRPCIHPGFNLRSTR